MVCVLSMCLSHRPIDDQNKCCVEVPVDFSMAGSADGPVLGWKPWARWWCEVYSVGELNAKKNQEISISESYSSGLKKDVNIFKLVELDVSYGLD